MRDSLNCLVKAGIIFGKDYKEQKVSKPLEKIQLKHLIIAFLILGVGCVVALLVFMIEMNRGTKVQEGEQGSSRENQNTEVSHRSD